MVLCVAVRIFSVRQQHHFDVEPSLQEHVNTSQRGVDAGGVTVIQHGDITGEALYQPYLRFGEGSTAAGNDVLNTGLMHGDNIHLTFYQVTPVCTGDRLFGLEKTV